MGRRTKGLERFIAALLAEGRDLVSAFALLA
jgi:hypothetical protein